MTPPAHRHAAVAAVPMAVALTLAAADAAQRLLPAFRYRPDAFGIVSRTTLLRYPTQQEVFWLVFAVAVGIAAAWGLARQLRGIDGLETRRGLGFEALGAAALAAAIWLPRGLGSLVAVAAVAIAVFLARRMRPAEQTSASSDAAPMAAADVPPVAASGAWPRVAVLLTVVLLAAVFSSHPFYPDGLVGGFANRVGQLSDGDLARDDPYFHGEWGEHLAWADELRAGGLPGRDFFCLYGPLYELSLLGVWQLFGRSLASFTVWQGLVHFAGMASALALGLLLVRRPVVLLLLPLLASHVSFRLGLGLLVLAALVQWRRSDDPRWCAAAGLLAGTGLVFSQEFGLAATGVAVLALLLGGAKRPAVAFGCALCAAPLAVAGYFAAAGGLGAMLADLVAYPGYVAAGYANLPYPDLLARLPLEPGTTWVEWKVKLRLAYSLPAIAAAGLLLCLPLTSMTRNPREAARRAKEALIPDPRTFGVAATALFGLLCIRSALGRSDMQHLTAVMAPAALLLCVGVDRAVAMFLAGGANRGIAAWRAAMLLLVVVQSGLWMAAPPGLGIHQSGEGFARALGSGPPPSSSERVEWLTRWLRDRTAPGDAVLMLPNLASYYYLAERRNPTRFALSTMIVSEAHRREVLADLQEDPPRYVVWDERGIRIDALRDEQVLGAATMAWLAEGYEPVAEERDFVIHAPRRAPARGHPDVN